MKALLRVVGNRLYGLFNFFLCNIPEDYYRMKFFSRKTKLASPDIYSQKAIENYYEQTTFSKL